MDLFFYLRGSGVHLVLAMSAEEGELSDGEVDNARDGDIVRTTGLVACLSSSASCCSLASMQVRFNSRRPEFSNSSLQESGEEIEDERAKARPAHASDRGVRSRGRDTGRSATRPRAASGREDLSSSRPRWSRPAQARPPPPPHSRPLPPPRSRDRDRRASRDPPPSRAARDRPRDNKHPPKPPSTGNGGSSSSDDAVQPDRKDSRKEKQVAGGRQEHRSGVGEDPSAGTATAKALHEGELARLKEAVTVDTVGVAAAKRWGCN